MDPATDSVFYQRLGPYYYAFLKSIQEIRDIESEIELEMRDEETQEETQKKITPILEWYFSNSGLNRTERDEELERYILEYHIGMEEFYDFMNHNINPLYNEQIINEIWESFYVIYGASKIDLDEYNIYDDLDEFYGLDELDEDFDGYQNIQSIGS
jgi:hypothetical protein